MLNRKIWLKFFGVMVGVMVLVGVIYAEKRNREVKKEIKSSWELVDEAYKQGKIDYDTAFLYKYYAHHFPELLPSEYKAEINIPLRAGTALNKLEDKELIKNWNKFRKETKEKIKFLRWKEMLELWKEEAPTVKIIHPGDNQVIYSSEIVIKGVIKTPEIYKLTNAWIEVSGKRYEIKLPKPEYIPPEDTYEDEKGRKNYLKWKEKYKDKPGLAELFGPPGQKLYPFTQKITLPKPGVYLINVNARSSYENSPYNQGSAWITILYVGKEDKKPPILEAKLFKDLDTTIPRWKYVNPIKDKEKISDDTIHVKVSVCDETDVLVYIYLDTDVIRVERVKGISKKEIEKNRYFGINRYPSFGEQIKLKQGWNKIKIVAIDSGGNKVSKKFKIKLVK